MTDDKPTTDAGQPGAGPCPSSPLGHAYLEDGKQRCRYVTGLSGYVRVLCAQPRSAHEAAPCTPSHCWSPDHHSMNCPARQPAAGGGEAAKPCPDAVRGGRGEWFCNTHKTGDPDCGCPNAPPATPAAEGDVHTSHCCLKHGCKYGYDNPELREMLGPNDVCTVANGSKRQEFPCELCRDQEDHERECHAELRAALASRDQQIARLEERLTQQVQENQRLEKGTVALREKLAEAERAERQARFREEQLALLATKTADSLRALGVVLEQDESEDGRGVYWRNARAERAEQERDRARMDADSWKASHENDIKAFIGRVQELIRERDALRASHAELLAKLVIGGHDGPEIARAKALQPTPNSPLDTSSSGA